jgi:hypothetical protein
MKQTGPTVALFCLTLAGNAWAQEPAPAAPSPTPEAQLAAQPAVAAPAPASSAAPQPAPIPLYTLPKTRPYRDDVAPPPGYVLSEEPRRGFLIGGIAALGASYLSGLLVAGVFMEFPNKSAFLAVPAAGPGITLATRDSCDNPTDTTLDCAADDLAVRLLLVDGIVQAVGVGLIVTGLTWTKSVWLREDLASFELVPGLNVARLPGDGQPQGLTLLGRF